MMLLLFTIDEHRYGVPAEAVGEIVRAVAVTPLPNAPAVVEGMIDLRGAIVPVFDLRRRFGFPRRDVDPADHFVIVHAPTRTGTRTAALHVDRVLELADADDAGIQTLAGQVQSAEHVAGVAALADGLAVIHDVSKFLSAAESESLDAALDAALGATRGP